MSNAAQSPFVARPSRRGGFTLFELLIVIGIIALLLSLLLPALNRARESAHQVTCLAHLRQVTAAIMAYVNDNDGTFPGAGGGLFTPTAQGDANDWLWWRAGSAGQKYTIDNIGNGGIGPYLHLSSTDPSSLSVLRCPSDDVSSRPKSSGMVAAYPFSYVINPWVATTGMLQPGQVRTLRQVKDSSQKILIYEENPQTIDDAAGNLMPLPRNPNPGLLAMRHDWAMHRFADGVKDVPSAAAASTTNPPTPQVPFLEGKGNAGFCDGHGEFISRQDAHSKAHYAPDSNDPAFTAVP